ncbi:MAG: hypothetical protein JW944_07840 [Deltaproteobacteria bacterium]|nr:hypothetical protein [Deltaproteobacteria bacterium]
MHSLDYPDIATDRLIIANYWAELFRQSGKIDPALARTVGVIPFTCPSRGYIVDADNSILLIFDPESVDPVKAACSIIDANFPLHIFILEDDQIVDSFEIESSSK